MSVRAASDDDLLARVYSMSEDDDPEIERLREVRNVFRELPEEEPPERGLAELMAAARVKADEMRPVSWWRRAGALLRRPPVLALASVMVLVGGAVLIGRRGGDDLDVARPSAPVADHRVTPSAPVAGGAAAPTTPPAQPEDKEAPPAGPTTTANVQAPAKPEPPPPARHAPPKLEVAPSRDEVAQQGAPPAETTKREKGDAAKDARDPSPTGTTSTGIAKDDYAAEGREVPDNDVKTGGKAPAQAPGLVDAKRPDSANKAEQMLRQCQVAAGRGDCVAVKAIAKRIEKDDASFYRERVAKDAAISRCLLAK